MPSRNPNLVEAVVRELAVATAQAVEAAEVATNIGHRVVIVTHHQAGRASVVTAAHCMLRGSVLLMDKTASPVVRLVTTVDTVVPNIDHQPLAEDHVEICMMLNLMKNMNIILSRSSTK